MIEQRPQSARLWELAQLPPADPRRQVLLQELQSMDPPQREYWMKIVRETDQLYARLPAVTMSPDLQERLLRLPDAPLPKRTNVLHLRRVWMPLTAAAAMLIAVTGYLLLPSQPRLPQLLDDRLALAIADQAVKSEQADPPLEVAAGNADQVKNALSAHKLTFPVIVLQPRDKLDLRGGGVCDFDGTPAVFTRWQGNGHAYTVYQFDGKPLGVPADFVKATLAATDLWRDQFHPRVVIWAGMKGLCTWALVLDDSTATDPFGGY